MTEKCHPNRLPSTTRRSVVREANRRGRAARVVLRGGRAEALVLATESAGGADPFGNCAVHDHWRPLFKRAFVKAATS